MQHQIPVLTSPHLTSGPATPTHTLPSPISLMVTIYTSVLSPSHAHSFTHHTPHCTTWILICTPMQTHSHLTHHTLHCTTCILTCTSICVDIVGQSVHYVPQALWEVTIWQALLQGVVEHSEVGVEGVLVHRVDGCHVRQHEEEEGSPSCSGTIAFTEFLNLFSSYFCFFQLLKYLHRTTATHPQVTT